MFINSAVVTKKLQHSKANGALENKKAMSLDRFRKTLDLIFFHSKQDVLWQMI